MGILKEFRAFISRGNVIDLAVGVIIGAAFGKVVSSLVTDVIMPPVGLLIKGIPFKDLAIMWDGQPLIAYGSFINTTIEFLIQAACVFALVKIINSLYKAEKKAAPPSKSEVLLEEIRDLLKKNG